MVSVQKEKLVADLTELCSKHSVVGIVNMTNLPAPQLQSMRKQLRGKVILRMLRKRLIQRTLKNSGKEELLPYLKGLPAILFSQDNPFALYKTLEKNKSKAPAKAGQIAPSDIIVKAGPTSFSPGPIIGELSSIGIKTGVEGGKLAIKEDAIVVKEGETISSKIAELLKRLGIEPMQVGLDLIAVIEKETLFEGKQLHIDEGEFIQNLINAAQGAINLSIESAYPTSQTIEKLICKAAEQAKNLAMESAIITKENVQRHIGRRTGCGTGIEYTREIVVIKKSLNKVF